MRAQSSEQNMFILAFRKIAPFWNGRRPIKTVNKTGQKWLNILRFLTPCKIQKAHLSDV